MPTYTTIALENFLEPSLRDSLKNPVVNGATNGQGDSNPRHLYISPALYVTPEQAPISDYSSHDPPSPSPYVVNHKRRRGGNDRMTLDSCQVSNLPSNEGDGLGLEEVVGDNFGNDESLGNDAEADDGFLDPREEVMSLRSEDDVNDLVGKQIESRSFVSAQGEFFDAIDDFSSDGSISNGPSYSSRIESELQATRRSLLEEIEKRKMAEETFMMMHNQWERLCNLMSQAGLTFPAPPAASDNIQLSNNMVDQFSQEVFITRFVAEAVGRGQARAEAEEAATAVIESKDQEILRLRDRLQYYEIVNHEMSQRKLVEVARRQQERKRSRRKWLWSFMGFSIALGASLVAYSYIPENSKCMSLLDFGDKTDASSVSSAEIS